jgi:hypothetical protein
MNKNSNFRYESDNFLKKINHESPQFVSLIPKSTGFISPGDILRFTYNSELVNVLVVRTKNGNGMFFSSRNNPLLTCFKLDDSPESILRIILRSIYKDKGIASYGVIQKGLKAILGSNSYRTYNIYLMSGLKKVTIDKSKLVTEEEKDGNNRRTTI